MSNTSTSRPKATENGNRSAPGVTSLETLVPRLGDLLVKQGLLRQDQLAAALAEQEGRQAAGRPILLGQLLLEWGLLSYQTLDKEIAGQIRQMQAELEGRNYHLEAAVARRTAELNVLVERLSQLDELKADFIASISHELNTPLFHLQVSLELLDDQQSHNIFLGKANFIHSARTAARQLQSLIDMMLSFSTATTTIKQQLNLTVFPIDVPVETVMGMMEQAAAQKSISLLNEIPEGLPPVQADQEKINWVLHQLVDNAVKFTPAGGQVAIRSHLSEASLDLAVIDTGQGIPVNKIDDAFEPFHQLDGGVARQQNGLGLGLALARRFIEAHGSKLLISSKPAVGTTVSFSLPLAG